MARNCSRCGGSVTVEEPDMVQDQRAVYCEDCGHIYRSDHQESLTTFTQGRPRGGSW